MIKSYSDVCRLLKEKEETCPYKQIKQIEKLFNGDWTKDFSSNQENWYPYFVYNEVSGYLVFNDSYYFYSYSYGQVSLYKNQEISDFVGKTFINIYNKL